MLKKLAKYGNSTALLIDKAILELLNMDESSIVKLHTDGKSLIITPVQANEKEKISYESSMETVCHAGKSMEAKYAKVAPLPPEVAKEMQEAFSEVFSKYKEVMRLFAEKSPSNQEFQNATVELAKKYDPTAQPEDYLKAYNEVIKEFFPEFASEFAEQQKEIAAIKEKYKIYTSV